MTQEGFKRKLTAILSADAVGYSRLMRDDEEATVRDIAAHRVLIQIDIKTGVGRTGLLCRINIRGTVVTFINVHFDHGEEAKQIQNVIQWLEVVTSPVCILGDLNLGPDDPLLQPLKERLSDSCQLAQTRLSEEAIMKGSLLKGDMRVDYIWIEPQFFTVQEAGLIAEPHRKVSDHIGYFADVLLT